MVTGSSMGFCDRAGLAILSRSRADGGHFVGLAVAGGAIGSHAHQNRIGRDHRGPVDSGGEVDPAS